MTVTVECLTTLVSRQGRATETPGRGSIIAPVPVNGFDSDHTWRSGGRDVTGRFLIDTDTQPVIVLWVSHWGRQVTVLTADGQHVDIRRESWERWLVLGQTHRPRGIKYPRSLDRTYSVPDVRPGDRFVHESAYSGPSSNFRCDVICEITAVTDEHVTFITLPHPVAADQDTDLARRWPQTVERLGFATVWSGHDVLVGAWLPRADDPWPFSDIYDTTPIGQEP